MNVFLSASVPIPRSGDERHFETADTVLIRDAVRSLAVYLAGKGKVVFGGHPAITPLLVRTAETVRGIDADILRLYQSNFFAGRFPPENQKVKDAIYIEAEGNLYDSLARMRRTMIEDTSICAAIFIGGMQGVLDEYQLFRQLRPTLPCLPIGSTGGAALELWKAYHANEPHLLKELTYTTLYRRHLVNLEA